MFKPESKKNWIETSADQVAYLATSVNRPVVVPPGRAPEPAQAYVCILRNKQGYEFYIYLHLIVSNLGLLYKWDAGAMPKDLVPQVQQAAAEFTESMGFMMSDMRWREMPPEQKEQTYNGIPVFYSDLARFKEVAEEEVLEIEPVSEEVVVESVEEPGQAVTEGDFVIPEDSFAEPKPEAEGMVFEELAPPAAAVEAPAGAEPAGAANEEDLLLDNLEAKEETISLADLAAKTESPELVIEIEEDVGKAEASAPAPAAVEVKEEIIWEKETAPSEAEVSAEPAGQVEEIVIGKSEEPETIAAPAAVAAAEAKASGGDAEAEDLKLMVRFLAMF